MVNEDAEQHAGERGNAAERRHAGDLQARYAIVIDDGGDAGGHHPQKEQIDEVLWVLQRDEVGMKRSCPDMAHEVGAVKNGCTGEGGEKGDFIGSVTDTKPLLQDLSRNRITVSRVFTSESIQVYKPQPEFYKRILASLGFAPGEVLFVGDSLNEDIQGPQRAGMRACWINRKNDSAGQIRPDFEIADLRELFHILDVGECG